MRRFDVSEGPDPDHFPFLCVQSELVGTVGTTVVVPPVQVGRRGMPQMGRFGLD